MAPIVHTYRSGETGLFVNSYLVEGADGVVAVDAPLLLSDGRAFRARLEALGKPLLGVLVTHPHPDHYNTITELLAGEGAGDRARRRPRDPRQGRRQARPSGGRCSATSGRPARRSRTGRWRTRSRSNSATCASPPGTSDPAKARARPSGCSTATPRSSATWPSTARTPTWPTGTRTRGWPRSTGPRRARRRAHALRRPRASARAVLADQRRYLLMAREAIARVAGGRAQLTEDEAGRVVGLMERYLPSAPLSWLVGAGARRSRPSSPRSAVMLPPSGVGP